MPFPRHLHDKEKSVIVAMARGLPIENVVLNAVHDAVVQEMNDGGMGSLKFLYSHPPSVPGFSQIREATYADGDGVPVSITLNVDRDGRLYELDIWKADNSPLKIFPTPESLYIK